jgi:hypothetical protein
MAGDLSRVQPPRMVARVGFAAACLDVDARFPIIDVMWSRPKK